MTSGLSLWHECLGLEARWARRRQHKGLGHWNVVKGVSAPRKFAPGPRLGWSGSCDVLGRVRGNARQRWDREERSWLAGENECVRYQGIQDSLRRQTPVNRHPRGGRPSMSEQSSLSSCLHGHSKNYCVLLVDAPLPEHAPSQASRCFPCPMRAKSGLRSLSHTLTCTLARRCAPSCDPRPPGLCSLPPHAHF